MGDKEWSEIVTQLRRERDEALAEAHEQARLLGMSAERELKLMAEVERLRAEILAHMTRQAQCQGEYDERQRDAERYRTIRRMIRDGIPPFDTYWYDESEIDAALRGEGDA